MAYDKVVDSSVLDAGLKQIANAIREKGGTSDNLAFPQAMADAIAAIEAGGGGGKAWFISDITIAEDVNPEVGLEITHNLGFIPAMIFVQDVSTTSNVLAEQVIFQISLVYKRTDGTGKLNRQSIHIVTDVNGAYPPYSFIKSTKCLVGLGGNFDTIREAHIANGNMATVRDVTENTAKIGHIGGYTATYKLKAGRTYRLIMGGIA